MTGTGLLDHAAEVLDDFAAFGMTAFTTGRAVGTFGSQGADPVSEVLGRWHALAALASGRGVMRLATSPQVHGVQVHAHGGDWEGWLRTQPVDGHVAPARGTAMAVTVADCVPVFLVHPSGASGVLHSGWRGTAGKIVERGIAALAHRGIPRAELRVHLGPAICGSCYEVSAEVYGQLTGRHADQPTHVDLRALIADDARAAGVTHISTSADCTRCDNDRYFSHRGGDAGRQVGVILG